jgi:hypothetical protein
MLSDLLEERELDRPDHLITSLLIRDLIHFFFPARLFLVSCTALLFSFRSIRPSPIEHTAPATPPPSSLRTLEIMTDTDTDKRPYSPGSPPRVIIVGAGIAGVFLGILLDRAKIPYEIYERAVSVKQLGTSVTSNSSLQRLSHTYPNIASNHASTPSPSMTQQVL